MKTQTITTYTVTSDGKNTTYEWLTPLQKKPIYPTHNPKGLGEKKRGSDGRFQPIRSQQDLMISALVGVIVVLMFSLGWLVFQVFQTRYP